MRRAAVFVLTLVTLLASAPQSGFGQGRPRRVDPSQTAPPPVVNAPGAQAPAGSDAEDTVSLEGALIEVPVVVSDRSGHYVPKLRQQDFRVLEDGVEQPVTFFSAERVPIHVAIVMDTSGSTRDTLGDIQQAAIDFIRQLEAGDKVMIVSFANQVIVEQEFTADRRSLEQAIRRTQPVGSTKLYDAVFLTVAERLRHVDGRKAMIILSDGDDTASQDATADEAINACSESDVVAYGIRYPESEGTNVYTNRQPFPPSYPQPRRRQQQRPRVQIPGIPWPNWPFVSPLVEPQFGGRSPGQVQLPRMGNDPFMETITANTGGTLFYAEQVTGVANLLAVIADELRNVYVIGYGPTNPLANGGYRRISVQVPRRPELAVRHRLGYQAEAYKK
jgi:Ca-activated chloride channel family protein